MKSQRMTLITTYSFFLILILADGLSADGNIGCLFSPSLCEDNVEQCYDDNAFGHCIQRYGNVEEDDLYRYDLSKEELTILEREMQRLFKLGYRWSHMYTQCTLQAVLYSFKTRTDYDQSFCDHLKDQDLDAALKAIENDVEQVEPQNMAYIKFTPSLGDPHADYADEVYFPPLTPEEFTEAVAIPPPRDIYEPEVGELLQNEKSPFSEAGYAEFPYSLLRKKSEGNRNTLPKHFNPVYNTPDEFRSGHESRDIDQPHFLNVGDRYPRILEETSGEFFPSGDFYPSVIQDIPENFEDTPVLLPSLVGFNREYNTPEKFRHGFETKDSVLESRARPVPQERGLLYHLGYQMSNNIPVGDVNGAPRGYTEGGMVFLPDKNVKNSGPEAVEEEAEEEALNQFLSGIDPALGWGFKRRERLDVKKPGPLFSTNNYAFQDNSGKNDNKNDADANANSPEKNANPNDREGSKEVLPEEFLARSERLVAVPNKKKLLEQKFSDEAHRDAQTVYIDVDQDLQGWNDANKLAELVANLLNLPVTAFTNIAVSYRKAMFRVDPNNNDRGLDASDVAKSIDDLKDELKKHGYSVTSVGIGSKKQISVEMMKQQEAEEDQFVVDTNYAYIGVEDSIRKWSDGNRIVETVANLLHIPQSTFSHVRVDRNEVTFKVDPNKNRLGLNASEVAKRIEGIKDDIKKELGITVTSAGLGDKTKLPNVLSLINGSDQDFYIISFILMGVVSAVVVSAAALYIIRRHAASREKLQNITAPDTEASKDYQDLCRARMASKPSQETAAPAGQRIASLSRESDNSPSSRSSTSSWGEEPALTNMDISTGHMVLSYMEDHLRNKDRLEQEWAALCAYEAEPCATTIAQRPENNKKNRYLNAVPYDHARVILNELSNISGSDYINASTITDHDPRNPAYIATQGPLPHTTPDLWQMVWEQGCVVMVMLTRLIENDNAMCHRYWPEEGSELYHIYEVHLVSEHIWCDDYLVRSFYLKNLKTGETRTVTQFHFLSWPDGSVPTSIKALLEFRRKVNKSFRGRSCPIVVHCSDGVGRTGTYCLLDMVLNRMAKGAKEIDIAATLEHIRDQRMGSVATKQQFQLVLAAVAEEVQAILRVLPQQPVQSQQQKEQQQQQQQQQHQ